jgi:hypothetical protein
MNNNNQNNNNNNNENKYRVVFSGCNHSTIMGEKQLHDPIETQWNPEKMIHEDVFVCHDCANGKPGFYHSTVLHSVQTATKLTPLELKRLLLFFLGLPLPLPLLLLLLLLFYFALLSNLDCPSPSSNVFHTSPN